MHLISLNIPDLLINLWRGTLHCEAPDNKSTWDWAVLNGDVWKAHGRTVAMTTAYLPGSFDRPPRNPAEKINSGYKAWEFLLYLFVLGPAVFRTVLPDKYWRHFCKLVYGVRVLHQRKFTRSQLQEAHVALVTFAEEFELLYYQRKTERIHFVRPSIHTLIHLAAESEHTGPLSLLAQWVMERTIGNLGEEVHLDSNPFANLSERGVHRAQTNALRAMLPSLDPENKLPRGAQDLGDGYVLLQAKDTAARQIPDCEAMAINTFLMSASPDLDNAAEPLGDMRVTKWARLSIPTGQVARSAWKETLKPLEKVRMARNVKASR